MKLARFLLAGLALSAASPALAATTPRSLPGYKCMMLDLTEQQSMDPSVHIQVRSGPSDSAPRDRLGEFRGSREATGNAGWWLSRNAFFKWPCGMDRCQPSPSVQERQ